MDIKGTRHEPEGFWLKILSATFKLSTINQFAKFFPHWLGFFEKPQLTFPHSDFNLGKT